MTLSLDDLLKSLTEDTGVEKSAAVQAVPATEPEYSDAAAELEQTLTKKATEIEVNSSMANAQEKGHAIADSILTLVKQAMDGLAPTAPGNRLITETAAQASQSTAGMAETPGGTMTQVLQSLVANSAANGAVRDDALAENAAGDYDETGAEQTGLPSSDGENLDSVGSDEVEKVAAVVALVDNGFYFDDAVEMVKAAAEELQAEEEEQVKVATVNCLMDEGLDLESAVALVKEAGKAGLLSQADEMTGGLFNVSKRYKNNLKESALTGVQKSERGTALAAASQDKAALKAVKDSHKREDQMRKLKAGAMAAAPAAGVVAGVGGGAALLSGNEKKAAAIEVLVGSGYTVAQALEILG